ncbi:hypothetical protein [Luteolibacter sp. Populi]|uniref:hypothetical protein n=1 Tax=Luteolibacter sp. Populi TaxID=3230487 RepID=UPI003464EF23
MICLAVGRAPGQVAAPPAVEQAAIAAVNDMGKEVVLGRHQAAIDRMFPPWKESLAKSVGGMDKLQEKLAAVPKMMAQQGIVLRSFRAEGTPTAYEVDAGKETVQEGGKPVEKMIFKKWLIVIPTATEILFTAPAKPNEAPKMHVVVSHSFQVAIADKDKNDWTFIDGSGLRLSDLRRLFFTLPDNMILPEIKGEEKKDR